MQRIRSPGLGWWLKVIALDSNIPGRRSFGRGFYAMTPAMQALQLAWLKEELEKPLATPFLAVMAHHPIYSNGKHGDDNDLIRDRDPLLREHKVHLYVAGHDHDLQHIEFANHPTSFFSSGAGGAALYDLQRNQSERGPFARKVFGFSSLEMNEDRLVLVHLNQHGEVIHAFAKDIQGNVSILD